MANEHFVYLPDWCSGIPSVNIHGEEHHHLSRVLRLKPGAEVRILNGKGETAKGVIEEIHKNETQCRITGAVLFQDPPAFSVTLAVGIIRRNRWEWLLEKAVELGVTRIVPLQSRYTVRESSRHDRDLKIMVSALKQCGRLTLPVLETPRPLDTAFQEQQGQGILLHNEAGIPYLGTVDAKMKEVTVYIGPEGGFSPEEIELAEKAGIQRAHMGSIRLRTETAAVCAATYFTYWHQEVL